jgi:hypothetical protein
MMRVDLEETGFEFSRFFFAKTGSYRGGAAYLNDHIPLVLLNFSLRAPTLPFVLILVYTRGIIGSDTYSITGQLVHYGMQVNGGSGITPAGSCPRPKPHPLLHLVAGTSPNMTSFVPVGDILSIPARFRVFVNYDL